MYSPAEISQCAADNIVVESKIVPPHPTSAYTCHGIGLGASLPPKILLVVLFINEGMLARKWSLFVENLYLRGLWDLISSICVSGNL